MNTQNVQNGTINEIRTMASSTLFLVGIIGYSAYLLFELLGSFTGGSGIMSMVNRIMAESGAYSSMSFGSMQAISGVFGSIAVLSTLFSMIPTMVVGAGIWMVFAAARQNRLPGIAATGLTMVRVIVIIQLVLLGILFFAAVVIGILIMIGSGSIAEYYGEGMPVVMLLGIVLVILLAFLAIEIIYTAKLSGMVRRMRETLVTGRPNAKISLFVEIICYIGGAGSAISALGSLAGLSVFGFLGNAGAATASISFGIFIRQYRSRMQSLEMKPQQPYQQPQQAYQPQTYTDHDS